MEYFQPGEDIRRRRENLKLTQAQLAERSGVSQPRISAIERGADTTTVTIRRLAEALAAAEAQPGDAS